MSGRGKGFLFAVAIAVGLGAFDDVSLAHEHKHTHQNLTRAAFRLLNLQAAPGGLTPQEIENELAQGVIDEDECVKFDDTGGGHDWGEFPNWNSHFYEAKLNTRLSRGIAGCDMTSSIQGEHSNAAQRAQLLYQMARDDYQDGKYRSAFRVLGRVLHLLQDMTSPAHVHDDAHGEQGAICGEDTDDFERYGYCEDLASSVKNRRICEYFHDQEATLGVVFNTNCETPPLNECLADFDSDGQLESYGVPPPGFTCRLWSALHILYGGTPQGYGPNPVGSNAGHAFVHKVSNVTYDFTTFTVHLQDTTNGDDALPEPSELSRMLRGSTVAHCDNSAANDVGLCESTDANGWRISGTWQDIGHTDAQGYNTEFNLIDDNEEWWLMPKDYSWRAVGPFLNRDIFIDGFAYIENAGGNGQEEEGTPDTFVPLRYGCTAAEAAANGRLCSTTGLGARSKAMYQQLYGTVLNHEDPFAPVPNVGKTMLRIYGDVLYTSAVAYGAGLIRQFIDQVTDKPSAAPGGPYTGQVCQPVSLNASASSDPDGGIATYEWDFTDDGTFDVASPDAIYPHTFGSPFTGQARLRVTDNEGFTNEATADVAIAADDTVPVISKVSATPARFWPPNHKMNPVAISVSVADACGTPTCRITGVSSNQASSAPGPKAGEPDWVVTGNLTLQVRAEASAHEDRRYTVTLSCEDESGNATTTTATVTVPRPPEEKTVPTPTRSAAAAKKGRYKKAGGTCVWDANDSGPNQCSPVKGRYKKVGAACVWAATDNGPNQCTPVKGRYKKAGAKCVWAANESGPNQCTPPKPR